MKSINIGAQVKMFKNTGMVLFVVLQVISELIVNWHSASATQRHASLSANGGGDIDGKRDKRFVLPFPTSSTVGVSTVYTYICRYISTLKYLQAVYIYMYVHEKQRYVTDIFCIIL